MISLGFDRSHKSLVESARAAKKTLIGHLELGTRDVDFLRATLEEFFDYQLGADYVSGQCQQVRALMPRSVEPPKYETVDHPLSNHPTELELHRADYQACKDAGFESPGELLSAYTMLLSECGKAKKAVAVLSNHKAAIRRIVNESPCDARMRGDINQMEKQTNEYLVEARKHAD